MKNRIVPILLVILVAGALVLNSEGKLVPIGKAIFQLPRSTPTQTSVGTFTLAFFVYLLLIAFLSDEDATWLTALIVLGGLVYNAKTNPNNNILSTLFTPGNPADNPFAGAGASGTASGSGPGGGIFNPTGPGVTVTPTG